MSLPAWQRSLESWALVRLERALAEHAERVLAIACAPLAEPSRDAYRRYLCHLFGFIAPFEARLSSIDSFDLATVQQRLRSGRMAMDLLALGLTPYERSRLTSRCAIPAFASMHDAIGWLFVVERVMREQPAVRGRLRATIPDDLVSASEFIGTLPDELEGSWLDMARVVDRHVHTKPELERTIAAARHALDTLEEWIVS